MKRPYTVKEVNHGQTLNDMVYDDSTKTYTVTLTRNADGTLRAEGAWSGDDETKDKFNNELTGTTSASVRKLWVGDTDIDGTVSKSRPDSITVQLQKKETGDDDYTDVTDKTETLTAAGNWRTSFDGLAKYDARGNEISYRVVETSVPAGYKATGPYNVFGTWVITNTYQTTELSVTKIWEDGNQPHNNSSELADAFVNDGVIDPVKLVLDGGDYSRDCHVVKTLKCGEVLPEGVHAFE